MGKSQAGMLQLRIYSCKNCAAITLHSVETTPFRVLTLEEAFVSESLNVTHCSNECGLALLRAALHFTDRQITFKVTSLLHEEITERCANNKLSNQSKTHINLCFSFSALNIWREALWDWKCSRGYCKKKRAFVWFKHSAFPTKPQQHPLHGLL